MHQLSFRPVVVRQMLIFINISSKVYFILKNYVRQPSQVDQNFVEFLSCRVRSSFPEQGVTSHIFNSAEVRCFTHERSYPCYQPGVLSRPHFLGVRPSIRPKPITVLLRDPAHPPFCSSDLGAYLPTTVSYTTVVPPSVTLAGLLQSIIDAKTTHPVRWGGACLPTHWFPAGHQPGLAIRQCAKGRRSS